MLTIITPIFCDTEDKKIWFSECIDSVVSQRFTNWKWIIVDDGSPISVEVPSNNRIKLIRRAKFGPSICRNIAVEKSTTDWILPLDADDILAPDALALLWNNKDPSRFVYGDVKYLNGNMIRFSQYSFEDTLKFLTGPVTAIHTKSLWKAVGGWKIEFDAGLEDVEYWIAAGAHGFCGKKIDGLTLFYRKHSDGRTSRMRASRRQVEMQRKIQKMHKNLYEGQRPESCCGKVTTSNAIFRSGELDVPGPKIWVTYTGKRETAFHVRGKSGLRYQVTRPRQRFQILMEDTWTFRHLGNGKDFSVG